MSKVLSVSVMLCYLLLFIEAGGMMPRCIALSYNSWFFYSSTFEISASNQMLVCDKSLKSQYVFECYFFRFIFNTKTLVAQCLDTGYRTGRAKT